MKLVLLGVSHKTAPLEIREGMSFSESSLRKAYGMLCAQDAIDEAYILSTCNRVELYAVGGCREKTERALREFLDRVHVRVTMNLESHLYRKTGRDAAMHLCQVAAGLDSMVPGENQIMGQIKRAYELASQFGAVGPKIHQLLQDALRLGKKVRTETAIARGVTSLPGAVLEMMKRKCEIRGKSVLVIGAGKIGALTVEKLARMEVREVVVVNRDKAKAECLKTKDKVRVGNYECLSEALAGADIVIAATTAETYVITREEVERIVRETAKEMLFFDLGVPRNIEESVKDVAGVRLFNVDHLGLVIENAVRSRSEEIEKAQKIIRESFARLRSESSFEKGLSQAGFLPQAVGV